MSKMSKKFVEELRRVCRSENVLAYLKGRGLIEDGRIITKAEAAGLIILDYVYDNPSWLNFGYTMRGADRERADEYLHELFEE